MTKRDAERLLGSYDAAPVEALTLALRIVLAQPDATWPDLVATAGFSQTRTAALLLGDEGALDALAAELNELRTLPHSPTSQRF